MNYDESLLHQQYERDNRPLNEDKIWCLFDKDGEFLDACEDREFIERIHDIGEGDILGWVWEKDFYPHEIEKTFKLLNYAE